MKKGPNQLSVIQSAAAEEENMGSTDRQFLNIGANIGQTFDSEMENIPAQTIQVEEEEKQQHQITPKPSTPGAKTGHIRNARDLIINKRVQQIKPKTASVHYGRQIYEDEEDEWK